MTETATAADNGIKPNDKLDDAPSNGIDLRSRIAAFSSEPIAEKLAKCLTEVTSLNKDLGSRLSGLVEELMLSQSSKEQAKNAAKEVPSLDQASILTTAPKISCANPKGKFDIAFTKETLALTNAKNLLQVKYTDIKAVFILDNLPQERSGKVYLVLQFKSPCTVKHGKRDLDNFTLEVTDKQQLDVMSPLCILQGKPEERTKGPAAVVLCGLLGQMQVTAFMAPDKAVFSGRGGASCIGGLLKMNSGYLFPLKDALLYIGSQCFVLSHDAILGVDMPGADSGRRFFDIVFHGHSGEKLHELQNVDMQDLPAWGDYMQRSRLKQVAHADPAAEAGTSAQAAAPEEDAAAPDTQQLHAAVANTEGSDDDDEEEDDEDFDADAEEVNDIHWKFNFHNLHYTVQDSDEDEGSQDHYAGGAGPPAGSVADHPKKRVLPDAGAGSSTGGAGGSAVAPLPTGPNRKRLRSAGNTEAFELPDDLIAAEMGELENIEEGLDSDDNDSDEDEDDS